MTTSDSSCLPFRFAASLPEGQAILSGEVRTLEEKDEADQAAWAAPGVRRTNRGRVVTGHDR
jgi:hypothetical protein